MPEKMQKGQKSGYQSLNSFQKTQKMAKKWRKPHTANELLLY